MTDANHWNVFDANCMLGRHCKWKAGDLQSADDLLTEMDHYGIAEAMVFDCMSAEHHPQDGNARVVRAVKPRPRLHAAWAALPTGAPDEQVGGEELVSRMRTARVGALWLFTRVYRFTLSDWCIDELIGPLAAARVPLFINPNASGGDWATDQTDWDGVVALCKRWPTLPVVVSEFRIRQTQRLIYRALEACPNLHIELSGYWLHHGIEHVTRRWGARRLIFGSHWPLFGQHMTLAPLTCADISDRDKHDIAGDNLRRLLAWCSPRHESYQPPPPADDFVAMGRRGTTQGGTVRAPMAFSDCHGHLGGRMSHYHVPDGDTDSLVAEMDRLGVARCCVFCFNILTDEQPGNDQVADAVRRYPDRFVGFTMLNPHRGPAEMRRELERCAAMGLRGIKLINSYQGYPCDGPNIEVACQWANERRQLILNHYWGSATILKRLVEKFSGACFITGHATAEYAGIMKEHPNLYVCSCPLIGPRACEDMVGAIGAERLMFGSDLSDLPVAWGLGPILFSRLPVEQKRMILGGNLERLLKTYSLTA